MSDFKRVIYVDPGQMLTLTLIYLLCAAMNCSHEGVFSPNPFNKCLYYVCGEDFEKVSMHCAQGASVPFNYSGESEVNPCTQHEDVDCGRCSTI